MFQFLRRKNTGTRPEGYDDITLSPGYYSLNYQDKWTFPWAPAPAHEQRSAIANCWTGNQLPGMINFIPGVNLSKFTWNVPTSYQNMAAGRNYDTYMKYLKNSKLQIGNTQYNKGFNIATSTSYQSSEWMLEALQAWQNRVGGYSQ